MAIKYKADLVKLLLNSEEFYMAFHFVNTISLFIMFGLSIKRLVSKDDNKDKNIDENNNFKTSKPIKSE